MPLLNLLPWCRLDREYEIGDVVLRPYSLKDELPGVNDEATRRHVTQIVSCYRDIEGRPFGHPSVAIWKGRTALDDLTEGGEETLGEMVTIACFASLASRDLASAGRHYSNSTRFTLYRHRFERVGDFTSLAYRRRDGRVLDGRTLSELRFTAPVETSTQSDIKLDEPLAKAVVAYRDRSSEVEWGRLFNALMWFTFGNSDSDSVSEHMEIVAHASAIQELLNCDSRDGAFAVAVSSELRPEADLYASRSRRNKGFWNPSTDTLRHEWARELYRVRNQYAHGRTTAHGQYGWGRTEHLTLAAIAFPLLAKQLLDRAGCYTLSLHEKASIRGFEQLLDSNFLHEPDPMEEDRRFPWDKIIDHEAFGIAFETAAEEVRTRGGSTPEPTGKTQ